MRFLVLVCVGSLAMGGCGKKSDSDESDPTTGGPKTPVPDDFSVVESSGPVRAEKGAGTYVEVKRGADGFTIAERHERPESGPDTNLEQPRSRALTDAEVTKLWAIVESKFLPLEKDYYSNPEVMDGGTSSIAVTANGSTKHVRVTNTSVPGFSAVAGQLYNLLSTAVRPPPTRAPDDFAISYQRGTLTGGTESVDQQLSLLPEGGAWVLVQSRPNERSVAVSKELALELYLLAGEDFRRAPATNGDPKLQDGTVLWMSVHAKGGDIEVRVFDKAVPAFDVLAAKLRALVAAD